MITCSSADMAAKSFAVFLNQNSPRENGKSMSRNFRWINPGNLRQSTVDDYQNWPEWMGCNLSKALLRNGERRQHLQSNHRAMMCWIFFIGKTRRGAGVRIINRNGTLYTTDSPLSVVVN